MTKFNLFKIPSKIKYQQLKKYQVIKSSVVNKSHIITDYF